MQEGAGDAVGMPSYFARRCVEPTVGVKRRVGPERPSDGGGGVVRGNSANVEGHASVEPVARLETRTLGAFGPDSTVQKMQEGTEGVNFEALQLVGPGGTATAMGKVRVNTDPMKWRRRQGSASTHGVAVSAFSREKPLEDDAAPPSSTLRFEDLLSERDLNADRQIFAEVDASADRADRHSVVPLKSKPQRTSGQSRKRPPPTLTAREEQRERERERLEHITQVRREASARARKSAVLRKHARERHTREKQRFLLEEGEAMQTGGETRTVHGADDDDIKNNHIDIVCDGDDQGSASPLNGNQRHCAPDMRQSAQAAAEGHGAAEASSVTEEAAEACGDESPNVALPSDDCQEDAVGTANPPQRSRPRLFLQQRRRQEHARQLERETRLKREKSLQELDRRIKMASRKRAASLKRQQKERIAEAERIAEEQNAEASRREAMEASLATVKKTFVPSMKKSRGCSFPTTRVGVNSRATDTTSLAEGEAVASHAEASIAEKIRAMVASPDEVEAGSDGAAASTASATEGTIAGDGKGTTGTLRAPKAREKPWRAGMRRQMKKEILEARRELEKSRDGENKEASSDAIGMLPSSNETEDGCEAEALRLKLQKTAAAVSLDITDDGGGARGEAENSEEKRAALRKWMRQRAKQLKRQEVLAKKADEEATARMNAAKKHASEHSIRWARERQEREKRAPTKATRLQERPAWVGIFDLEDGEEDHDATTEPVVVPSKPEGDLMHQDCDGATASGGGGGGSGGGESAVGILDSHPLGAAVESSLPSHGAEGPQRETQGFRDEVAVALRGGTFTETDEDVDSRPGANSRGGRSVIAGQLRNPKVVSRRGRGGRAPATKRTQSRGAVPQARRVAAREMSSTLEAPAIGSSTARTTSEHEVSMERLRSLLSMVTARLDDLEKLQEDSSSPSSQTTSAASTPLKSTVAAFRPADSPGGPPHGETTGAGHDDERRASDCDPEDDERTETDMSLNGEEGEISRGGDACEASRETSSSECDDDEDNDDEDDDVDGGSSGDDPLSSGIDEDGPEHESVRSPANVESISATDKIDLSCYDVADMHGEFAAVSVDGSDGECGDAVDIDEVSDAQPSSDIEEDEWIEEEAVMKHGDAPRSAATGNAMLEKRKLGSHERAVSASEGVGFRCDDDGLSLMKVFRMKRRKHEHSATGAAGGSQEDNGDDESDGPGGVREAGASTGIYGDPTTKVSMTRDGEGADAADRMVGSVRLGGGDVPVTTSVSATVALDTDTLTEVEHSGLGQANASVATSSPAQYDASTVQYENDDFEEESEMIRHVVAMQKEKQKGTQTDVVSQHVPASVPDVSDVPDVATHNDGGPLVLTGRPTATKSVGPTDDTTMTKKRASASELKASFLAELGRLENVKELGFDLQRAEHERLLSESAEEQRRLARFVDGYRHKEEVREESAEAVSKIAETFATEMRKMTSSITESNAAVVAAASTGVNNNNSSNTSTENIVMAAAVAAGIATSASLSKYAILNSPQPKTESVTDAAGSAGAAEVAIEGCPRERQATLMESYTADFESFDDMDANAGGIVASGTYRKHAAMMSVDEGGEIDESIAEELEAFPSTPGSSHNVAEEIIGEDSGLTSQDKPSAVGQQARFTESPSPTPSLPSTKRRPIEEDGLVADASGREGVDHLHLHNMEKDAGATQASPGSLPIAVSQLASRMEATLVREEQELLLERNRLRDEAEALNLALRQHREKTSDGSGGGSGGGGSQGSSVKATLDETESRRREQLVEVTARQLEVERKLSAVKSDFFRQKVFLQKVRRAAGLHGGGGEDDAQGGSYAAADPARAIHESLREMLGASASESGGIIAETNAASRGCVQKDEHADGPVDSGRERVAVSGLGVETNANDGDGYDAEGARGRMTALQGEKTRLLDELEEQRLRILRLREERDREQHQSAQEAEVERLRREAVELKAAYEKMVREREASDGVDVDGEEPDADVIDTSSASASGQRHPQVSVAEEDSIPEMIPHSRSVVTDGGNSIIDEVGDEFGIMTEGDDSQYVFDGSTSAAATPSAVPEEEEFGDAAQQQQHDQEEAAAVASSPEVRIPASKKKKKKKKKKKAKTAAAEQLLSDQVPNNDDDGLDDCGPVASPRDQRDLKGNVSNDRISNTNASEAKVMMASASESGDEILQLASAGHGVDSPSDDSIEILSVRVSSLESEIASRKRLLKKVTLQQHERELLAQMDALDRALAQANDKKNQLILRQQQQRAEDEDHQCARRADSETEIDRVDTDIARGASAKPTDAARSTVLGQSVFEGSAKRTPSAGAAGSTEAVTSGSLHSVHSVSEEIVSSEDNASNDASVVSSEISDMVVSDRSEPLMFTAPSPPLNPTAGQSRDRSLSPPPVPSPPPSLAAGGTLMPERDDVLASGAANADPQEAHDRQHENAAGGDGAHAYRGEVDTAGDDDQVCEELIETISSSILDIEEDILPEPAAEAREREGAVDDDNTELSGRADASAVEIAASIEQYSSVFEEFEDEGEEISSEMQAGSAKAGDAGLREKPSDVAVSPNRNPTAAWSDSDGAQPLDAEQSIDEMSIHTDASLIENDESTISVGGGGEDAHGESSTSPLAKLKTIEDLCEIEIGIEGQGGGAAAEASAGRPEQEEARGGSGANVGTDGEEREENDLFAGSDGYVQEDLLQVDRVIQSSPSYVAYYVEELLTFAGEKGLFVPAGAGGGDSVGAGVDASVFESFEQHVFDLTQMQEFDSEQERERRQRAVSSHDQQSFNRLLFDAANDAYRVLSEASSTFSCLPVSHVAKRVAGHVCKLASMPAASSEDEVRLEDVLTAMESDAKAGVDYARLVRRFEDELREGLVDGLATSMMDDIVRDSVDMLASL